MKAMPISASLRRCATHALSNRSAISPPSADKKKYGAMKTAAATWVRASASGPATLNTSRNTSAFLRKLSLNAEKNWHQNKGAKRRVVKSDEAMIFPRQGVGHRAPLQTPIRAKGQS